MVVMRGAVVVGATIVVVGVTSPGIVVVGASTSVVVVSGTKVVVVSTGPGSAST